MKGDAHHWGGCACFACSLRAARLNELCCIPLDVLPADAARSALEALAAAGCDMRVIAPVSVPTQGRDDGEWGVWLGAVAAERADGNGYVPLRVWRVGWQYLVVGANLGGYCAGLLALDEVPPGQH